MDLEPVCPLFSVFFTLGKKAQTPIKTRAIWVPGSYNPEKYGEITPVKSIDFRPFMWVISPHNSFTGMLKGP